MDAASSAVVQYKALQISLENPIGRTREVWLGCDLNIYLFIFLSFN